MWPLIGLTGEAIGEGQPSLVSSSLSRLLMGALTRIFGRGER